MRLLIGIMCLLSILNFKLFSQKIKTAVYWTSPIMNITEAKKLSKFDLIIVDLENKFNNRPLLDSIKKENPNIKLLCYSNPMEIFNEAVSNRPLQNTWRREILNKYPGWLLKDVKSNNVIFYPGMIMLNLTVSCPKIEGKKYSEYMSQIILDSVLSDKIWDGYFMDNGTPNISWVNPSIDANNDGIADENFILDREWSLENYSFLKTIREKKGKDFVIIANKGVPAWMDILDGRMFEDFPNNYLGGKRDGGWYQSMANAEETGTYTIFQVKEKNLMFGIASAQLLETAAYVAVGQNNNKFYPEFSNDLGGGETIKIYREFKKGNIEVIPSQKKGKISVSNSK